MTATLWNWTRAVSNQRGVLDIRQFEILICRGLQKMARGLHTKIDRKIVYGIPA